MSFNVPEELYFKLSEQARIEERPVSQIVRRILSKHSNQEITIIPENNFKFKINENK